MAALTWKSVIDLFAGKANLPTYGTQTGTTIDMSASTQKRADWNGALSIIALTNVVQGSRTLWVMRSLYNVAVLQTGTVYYSGGTGTVVGVGTNFTALSAGQKIQLNGLPYTVSNVNSATNLNTVEGLPNTVSSASPIPWYIRTLDTLTGALVFDSTVSGGTTVLLVNGTSVNVQVNQVGGVFIAGYKHRVVIECIQTPATGGSWEFDVSITPIFG